MAKPPISENQPTIENRLKERFVFSILEAVPMTILKIFQGVILLQVKIKIDSSYTEPQIIILTDSMSEEINNIVNKLSANVPQIISGSKDQKVEVLEEADLIRIYANSGKVYAVTSNGEYTLRLRLYEIEQRLNPYQFVRISNSEIINLKKVNNFDLSYTGTICVKMSNGTTTYVSRRYVARIKKILGI